MLFIQLTTKRCRDTYRIHASTPSLHGGVILTFCFILMRNRARPLSPGDRTLFITVRIEIVTNLAGIDPINFVIFAQVLSLLYFAVPKRRQHTDQRLIITVVTTAASWKRKYSVFL